jgi:hypothetical protein
MYDQATCTEEQATTLAGVSARTLHRFCESGYLTVTTDESGSRRYQVNQLSEIFGVAHAPQSEEGKATSRPVVNETTDSQPAAITKETSEPESAGNTRLNNTTNQAHRPHDETPSPTSTRVALLELEVQRLKNLLEIQERILDAKDDEIADLRNQRAWLRERVEKFEEKSDRDQILLLSETQTIRTLLAYHESRKSTMRQLLEWVGLARTPQLPGLSQATEQMAKGNHTSRTIEVKRAANADY